MSQGSLVGGAKAMRAGWGKTVSNNKVNFILIDAIGNY